MRALRQLLPQATLSVIHERPWHSLTFSGSQICISAILHTGYNAEFVTRIAQILPEHEFELSGQLVADIAVIEMASGENPGRLMIDALLLDD
jgi:hypothetical protein